MDPLTLGLMFGVGAGVGVFGRQDENRKRQNQLNQQNRAIAAQRLAQERQRGIATDQSANALAGQAMQASASNRDAAVAAFQNTSAAEANEALTGTSGGTVQMQTALNRNLANQAIRENDSMNLLSLNNIVLGAQAQDASFDLQEVQLDLAQEDLAMQYDELEYAQSFAGLAMAGLTGGMAGIQTGTSLMSTFDMLGSYMDNPAEQARKNQIKKLQASASPDGMWDHVEQSVPATPMVPTMWDHAEATGPNYSLLSTGGGFGQDLMSNPLLAQELQLRLMAGNRRLY